jgi:hypothetical protein
VAWHLDVRIPLRQGSNWRLLARQHRRATQGRTTDVAVSGVRYRLEVRLTPADVGQRVVIRWRPAWPDAGGKMTDVLGILEEHGADSFTVRKASGQLVVIPRERAVAGKVVPPAPPRPRSRRPQGEA